MKDRPRSVASTHHTPAPVSGPQVGGAAAVDRRLRAYTTAVIAAGAVVLALAVSQLPRVDPGWFAALTVLAVSASLFKLDLRLSDGSATMTLGYAVGFLGLATLGPDATAIAVSAGIWTQCTYRTRFSAVMDLRRRLFSVACGALTVESAGWAYAAAANASANSAVMVQIAPLAAASLVYFFSNTGLVAGAIALSTGRHVVDVWHKNFLLSWPSFFVSAFVVGLGTTVVDRSGYFAGLLVLLPLLLTFMAYRAYLGRLAEEQEQLRIAKDSNEVDMLTGLPNRLSLMGRIERALLRHRASPGGQFAVLFIDLDGFKQINDGLGHHGGDQLLQALAHRLQESLRSADVVLRPDIVAEAVTLARLGGDEFVVLLDRVSGSRDAVRVADRLQAVLARPFELAGRQVYVTASVGISLGSAACATAEDVLRDADTAMYRAKTLGKARSEVFDASVRGHVLGRTQRDAEIRTAVDRHEFIPFYQPIIDLDTGRIAGFEALLRWQHPQHGIIEPAEFISVMEDHGLVSHVGRKFFSDVCRQLAAWKAESVAARDIAIHINFSGQQFLDPGLVDNLLLIADEVGIHPGQIVLEVTETSAIRQFSRAVEVLERARAAGLRIVLDDFGTGYSSLSCLHELPISGIKLDRSFLTRERRHPAILQAIVALADQLKLTVTAEGVETLKQCEELRAIGCDLAQGYLFSRPVAARQAGAFLAQPQSWLAPSERGRGPVERPTSRRHRVPVAAGSADHAVKLPH